MAGKLQPTESLPERLRAHGFEVVPCAGEPESWQVSRNGVAAVLSADAEKPVLRQAPGILIRGKIAHLLDRGYQKFFAFGETELPATADMLHSVHSFSEELKQLVGSGSIFNESLGTTSNLYHYDRVRGREVASAQAAQPWEHAAGH